MRRVKMVWDWWLCICTHARTHNYFSFSDIFESSQTTICGIVLYQIQDARNLISIPSNDLWSLEQITGRKRETWSARSADWSSKYSNSCLLWNPLINIINKRLEQHFHTLLSKSFTLVGLRIRVLKIIHSFKLLLMCIIVKKKVLWQKLVIVGESRGGILPPIWCKTASTLYLSLAR